MILLLLVLFPVLGGAITLFGGKQAKGVAFLASAIQFVLTLVALNALSDADSQRLFFSMPWVRDGIEFSLMGDGLSMLLVLLTSLLLPLIILSAWNRSWEREATYYALMLFMQAGLTGVFLAADAFLFYIMWEAALIPIYFLAAAWGPGFRSATFFKFFIYTIFGSLFMLVAFIYLYAGNNASGLSSSLEAIYNTGRSLDLTTQRWIFWGLLAAFAIKMPIFPFHTWQPDTYTEAPPQATMLLSGIMLKMGIYGVMRWLLPVVPDAANAYQDVVMVMAIIGIIYGSVIAVMQRDMKRLLAYSSFAHVGLMAAGIFAMNNNGFEGAAIQMLAHGINVVGLFYVVDLIERNTGTREIARLGGITQTTPSLTVYSMILMLGSVALPLTSGFPGEFLLLNAVFEHNYIMGAVAGLTIILGAVYMLRMYQGVMFGPRTEVVAGASWKLEASSGAVLFVLCFLVLWIGLHPGSFMQLPRAAFALLINKF